MNKKILTSILSIAVVAVVGIAGTIAYFNDTETSANNVFVAGTIDLKVDHRYQWYNGLECSTCNLVLYSDTDVVVEETGNNAVAAWVHQNWAKPDWAPPAQWIWATEYVQNPGIDEEYTFVDTFVWGGPVVDAELELALAADNRIEVILNGTTVYNQQTEHNYENVVTVDISNYIAEGANTIKFVVENIGIPGSTPTANPAALLYKLVVGGECGQQDFLNTCRLWQEKNLDEGDSFFNFGDVKPGDFGKNVVSLHVESNDAWVCMSAKDQTDNENEIIESETGDTTTSTGELGSNIFLFAWNDANGNGLRETGETAVTPSPVAIKNFNNVGINVPETTGLTAGDTEYVALAWCAGTLTGYGEGETFVCDGSTMGNESQSDSFSAKLEFYAEQTRNNGNFVCEEEVVDLQ